jgi:hypothetical protein
MINSSKMRKIFKCYVLAACMVAGLMGCSVETALTEKTVKTEGDAVESVPTYATFSWVVDDSGLPTRAGGTMENDGGVTNEGKLITDIRLLVFNAKDSCEVNRVFTTTSVADTKATIKIIPGTKKIFVIANTGSGPLATALQTKTAAFQQLYAMMYDLNLNTATDASTSLAVPNHIDGLAHLINPSTGFVMSNRIDAASLVTIVPNVDSISSSHGTSSAGDVLSPVNHFTIRIQRAVAKVGIRLASADILNNVDGGRLVSPRVVLKNVNRALYLFQHFSSPFLPSSLDSLPVSPWYGDDSSTGTDVLARHYFHYTNWEPLGTTVTKSYYVTENTHGAPTYENTTWAAIEAVFLPKAGKVLTNDPSLVPTAPGALKYNPSTKQFEGATYNTADMTVAPAVLYRLDLAAHGYSYYGGLPSVVFFANRELAYKVAYIVRTGSESGWNAASMESIINAQGLRNLVAEYEDGRCYYRALVGRPHNVGGSQSGVHVYRNYAFTVTVNSFSRIGASGLTEEDLNYPPTTPTEEGETFLTTRVEMEDWNSYAYGEILW